MAWDQTSNLNLNEKEYYGWKICNWYGFQFSHQIVDIKDKVGSIIKRYKNRLFI